MHRRTAVGCLGGALLASCSSGHHAGAVVGSKNFTEQVVLGEIVAQHLERKLHLPVDRKLNLGGTLLTHGALIGGQIDVYPEYTGTAIRSVLKEDAVGDAAAVLEHVRQIYRQRWQVEWLPPLGFNNPFAMVIRGEDARKYGIETLSAAVRPEINWNLGVGYEFLQRPDGLDALKAKYALRSDASPRSMDLGLLYRALEDHQVDMVAGNATDGLLTVKDLKVLRDDRAAFTAYEACLLVKNPALQRTLQELSGKISTEAMRKLNYQIDGEHKPVKDVAAAWLSEQG